MRFLLRPVAKQDLRECQMATQENEEGELMRANPDKKFPMTAWMLSRYTPKERTSRQVAHAFIVASFESTLYTPPRLLLHHGRASDTSRSGG